MTDSSSAADAMRATVKAHLVDSLNRGTTVQTAVNAAIGDGLDETMVRNVGRGLRDDMVRLLKSRAMKKVRAAALWMVLAIPLGIALILFVPIPFIALVAPAMFFTGLVRIIIGFAEHAGVEGKVR